jgi:hypothetical protein
MSIDGQQIRKALLEAINKFSNSGSSLQANSVFTEVKQKLNIAISPDIEQAILTSWYDLFRMGHLAWGYNLSNPFPPWFHLTEQGRKALQHMSRDPANPDGYLAHLSKVAALDAIAESYIIEALKTYNAACYKAAAVMIGVSAESIILNLRDTLVNQLKILGKTHNKDLEDWRIKRILDVFKKIIDSKKGDIPKELFESYEAYWPAFTQQIRTSRNEAGHPSSIGAITEESVHASLLIFPELARLASELNNWIIKDLK